MKIFYLFMLIVFSCTVPDKTSLQTLMDTKQDRKSPLVLRAVADGEVTNDKFEVRANNTFIYYSHLKGSQRVTIYAGTLTREGDRMMLNFHNGHKEESWTGMAVIDRERDVVRILSTEPGLDKVLAIEAMK